MYFGVSSRNPVCILYFQHMSIWRLATFKMLAYHMCLVAKVYMYVHTCVEERERSTSFPRPARVKTGLVVWEYLNTYF